MPGGWSVRELGEIGKYLNGFPFKPTQWTSYGLPIIRIQNLTDERKPFNHFDGQVDPRYLIAPGDILVSWSASLGAFRWTRGKAWLNQHIFKATPNGELVDGTFFYYLMRHTIDRIAKNARGSTMHHVTLKEFVQSEVAVPTLAEQRQIALLLSAVQRTVERQEQMIVLTAELKKALMHKFFTEGTRGERFKQTEIGLVPEEWQVKRLVDLLREPVRNGHSAKETPSPSGIRTLTLTAVTRADFSLENTKTTVASREKVKNLWLHDGDIFIQRANTLEYVGLAALYEGPNDFAIFPDLLVRIRLREDEMLPKVLAEYLITPRCRRYFRMNAKGTAGNFPKIDQGTIENLQVPVPISGEQAAIESAARAIDTKHKAHVAMRTGYADLFRTLLHQLMTAQVRVDDLDLSALNTSAAELAGVI